MNYTVRRRLAAVPLFLLRTVIYWLESFSDWATWKLDTAWHDLHWWRDAPLRGTPEYGVKHEFDPIPEVDLTFAEREPYKLVVTPGTSASVSPEVRDYSGHLAPDEGWPEDSELYPRGSCDDHGVLDCMTCDRDANRP